jgi:hypothetical protein
VAKETYYWTRDTQRGRKEAFWSNGELQLRVHGPMSHVNAVMRAIVSMYDEPSVPTGPPPKDVKLPEIHPGQTDLVEEIEKLEAGSA